MNEGFEEKDLPDNMLLRYLHGYKYDLNEARQRLTDTLEWRRANDADNLTPERIELEYLSNAYCV